MKKIGIISDTHGYLHPAVFGYFADRDEIWHAGDFGDGVIEQLQKFKPLRGVYGNIDSALIRKEFPEQIVFRCEQVKVMMRHIGGYPPKYNAATKKELLIHRPQLFIDGHSHILKIMYDKNIGCLHINPGAASNQGWHTVKTIVTLDIDNTEMKNCKVIELE
ncbi:MAG: metallophosphoesterase family protein [Chitinophagaceae bacterium]|nr:metallophosphoesterase family protein [Chitinophagaceae bacterium]